jgi:hypothetical protein
VVIPWQCECMHDETRGEGVKGPGRFCSGRFPLHDSALLGSGTWIFFFFWAAMHSTAHHWSQRDENLRAEACHWALSAAGAGVTCTTKRRRDDVGRIELGDNAADDAGF